METPSTQPNNENLYRNLQSAGPPKILEDESMILGDLQFVEITANRKLFSYTGTKSITRTGPTSVELLSKKKPGKAYGEKSSSYLSNTATLQ